MCVSKAMPSGIWLTNWRKRCHSRQHMIKIGKVLGIQGITYEWSNFDLFIFTRLVHRGVEPVSFFLWESVRVREWESESERSVRVLTCHGISRRWEHFMCLVTEPVEVHVACCKCWNRRDDCEDCDPCSILSPIRRPKTRTFDCRRQLKFARMQPIQADDFVEQTPSG
jgi:hypothetical protein